MKVLKVSGRMPALVLVYPGTPVYTKEVYGRLKAGTKAGISANLRDFRELCRLVRAGGFVAGASGRIFNRLEEPVLPRHKAVRLAKARLLKFGADAALMSGSGASVFGLFNSGAKAARAAAEMGRMRGCKVFLTKFC